MMCLYRYAADNDPYSCANTCRHHDTYKYTHPHTDGYPIGSDPSLILKAYSDEAVNR
jgi:hypothetical protein